MDSGRSTPHPRRLTLGKAQYKLYRRLGGPQGRSGCLRKISPAPGFDYQAVHPIASRYTEWAIVESTVCHNLLLALILIFPLLFRCFLHLSDSSLILLKMCFNPRQKLRLWTPYLVYTFQVCRIAVITERCFSSLGQTLVYIILLVLTHLSSCLIWHLSHLLWQLVVEFYR
jgi:hypothetical protein